MLSKLPNHPMFSGGRCAILTAQFPKYPSEVQGENESLKKEMKVSNTKNEPTKGSYGSGIESSFILHGLDRQAAFDIGRKYGQEAIVYTEGNKHELLYTNGPNAGKAHPHHTVEWFGDQQPDDYWTYLPGHGYFRIVFDEDRLEPKVHPSLHKAEEAVMSQSQPQEGLRTGLHSYPWHDPHESHHFVVKCPAGLLGKKPELNKAEQPKKYVNEQAAGAGVQTYAKFALPYGQISPGRKTDLNHYPLQGKLPDVQQLVAKHGYQVYYAGGQYGRPDLATKNYNTKHLMIYDPDPGSGGDFGNRDYTDAWRQSHELAHALTYPDINKIYGEGRRIGKLGTHRSLNEAMRAVHWEHLAAHKQRELLSEIGVHIPDDAFAREYNTVMHDAVHRAVTGKFTEPSDEGFMPHSHLVPLDHSLQMVRREAHSIGLANPHSLLNKSEQSIDRAEENPLTAVSTDEVRSALVQTLKRTLDEHEKALLELRRKELAKSTPATCLVCGGGACKCQSLIKADHDKALYNGEERDPKSVLPGEKKSKEVAGSEGSGGLKKNAKRMAKKRISEFAKDAKPPMAKPPTKAGTAPAPSAKTGSPAPTATPPKPPAAVTKADPVEKCGEMDTAKSEVEKCGDMKPAKKSEIPGREVGRALSKSLEKAGPRLGGKDPASQMMTQHASMAAPKPGAEAAPAASGPKLTPEDHARRAAEYSAFTPASHFGVKEPGAATANEMTTKRPAIPGRQQEAKPVAKPMGTAAAPSGGGVLDRFRAALKGGAMTKAEPSETARACKSCGKSEHSGPCC